LKTYFPRLDQIESNSTVFGIAKYAIIMEDLTYGYIKPCVMDIKMGTKTYAENSNLVKKKFRQLKDYESTSSRYGLRITGFRTFSNKTGHYVELSKESAEKITTLETLDKHIQLFFDNGNEIRYDVIKYYLEKLNLLYNWMEIQTVYRFYSSSILFIYDGGLNELKADLRMIDFAHVHEIKDNGTDIGYVFGLKKLIDILKKNLKEPL